MKMRPFFVVCVQKMVVSTKVSTKVSTGTPIDIYRISTVYLPCIYRISTVIYKVR